MTVHIEPKSYATRMKTILLMVIAFTFILDFPVIDIPEISPVRDAQARIGRPASPNSVAGVHRRTRRRVRRRHIAIGTRIRVLPVGYTTVVVTGRTYYVYEDVYYLAYYEGNEVVYVVVEKP